MHIVGDKTYCLNCKFFCTSETLQPLRTFPFEAIALNQSWAAILTNTVTRHPHRDPFPAPVMLPSFQTPSIRNTSTTNARMIKAIKLTNTRSMTTYHRYCQAPRPRLRLGRVHADYASSSSEASSFEELRLKKCRPRCRPRSPWLSHPSLG